MVIATLTGTGIVYPNTIHSDKANATQWQTPFDVLTNTSGVQQIKEAISFIAIKYGIEPSELIKVIQCESFFNHAQYGDSGLAYGLAQFHKPTFEEFNKQRDLVLNYYSLKDQLDTMAWAWTKGYKFHWSCWKRHFTH